MPRRAHFSCIFKRTNQKMKLLVNKSIFLLILVINSKAISLFAKIYSTLLTAILSTLPRTSSTLINCNFGQRNPFICPISIPSSFASCAILSSTYSNMFMPMRRYFHTLSIYMGISSLSRYLAIGSNTNCKCQKWVWNRLGFESWSDALYLFLSIYRSNKNWLVRFVITSDRQLI